MGSLLKVMLLLILILRVESCKEKARETVHLTCKSEWRLRSGNTGGFTCIYEVANKERECRPDMGYCQTIFWRCLTGHFFPDWTRITQPCKTCYEEDYGYGCQKTCDCLPGTHVMVEAQLQLENVPK